MLAYDDGIQSIAGLATEADRLLLSDGVDSFTAFTLATQIKAFLQAANTVAARAAIGASQSPLDEDDFASDSDAQPPTQQSTGAFVRSMAGNQSGAAPIYAARAWVNFEAIGTITIRASGNVTSITDQGVGLYTVNLTVAMQDNDYVAVGNAGNESQDISRTPLIRAKTTSNFLVATTNISSGGAVDVEICDIIVLR